MPHVWGNDGEDGMMAALGITTRLSLRELDESYLEAVAEMMGDPRVNEFFYGFQSIKNSTELVSYTSTYFFKSFSKTHAEFGIGGLAIHERGASASDEGTFVGFTGFFPPTTHHPEFGPELVYILGPHCHGKGYAFEAANAAIEYARAVKIGRASGRERV